MNVDQALSFCFNDLMREARVISISRKCELIRFTFQRKTGEKFFLHASVLSEFMMRMRMS